MAKKLIFTTAQAHGLTSRDHIKLIQTSGNALNQQNFYVRVLGDQSLALFADSGLTQAILADNTNIINSSNTKIINIDKTTAPSREFPRGWSPYDWPLTWINTGVYRICVIAPRNSSVVLRAPAGAIFTSIDFASFGTPLGTCGAFTTGACHSVRSRSVVENAFLGRNAGSVLASTSTFFFGFPVYRDTGTTPACGNPANVFRLIIQATATGPSRPITWNNNGSPITWKNTL